MRIAFYGNVANNFYQIVKALRRWPDMDAHLFVDFEAEQQTLPESDEPSLRNNYPHWIHKASAPRLRHKLFPWRSPLVAELADFDVVVVSGGGPMLANFSATPVAFYATGYDVTVAPFPIEFAAYHRRALPLLKALWFGALQRRGIRRCKELWVAPFEPFRAAVEKLKVPESRVSSAYFPLIIDTEHFGALSAAQTSAVSSAVQAITSRFDFTVFHPSRLMINASPKLRAAGQWKANDTLLRAFARFVEQSGRSRAGLVLIDRPTPDLEAAKQLIRELGIESNVLWLAPPSDVGFTRAELIALYSACDVVADDFGVGWFGSVVLEALTLRRPVLCYVDELAMRRLYSWHPLLSSDTVEGNARFLLELSRDAALRHERGESGRRWIDDFHAPESAGRIYLEHFRRLAARIGVERGDTVNEDQSNANDRNR